MQRHEVIYLSSFSLWKPEGPEWGVQNHGIGRCECNTGAFWLSWRLVGTRTRALEPPSIRRGLSVLPPKDLISIPSLSILHFNDSVEVTPIRPISRDQFLTFSPLSVGGAFPRRASNWDFGKLGLYCSSGCGQAVTQWGLECFILPKAWINKPTIFKWPLEKDTATSKPFCKSTQK